MTGPSKVYTPTSPSQWSGEGVNAESAVAFPSAHWGEGTGKVGFSEGWGHGT